MKQVNVNILEGFLNLALRASAISVIVVEALCRVV